ncbi:hypothetical protein [Gracilibacillus kekensis]|uniref:hypothetical protein n=1 Tax=Gracilibacillus kekensis TaxID=1027249 RepID=UPI0031391FE6
MEVEDVDVYYKRMIKDQELPLLLDIRDEPFGQRHFITEDPNGILVDVITIIPPDPSFMESYHDKVWEDNA